jgi:uncharacterized protein YajQ (UPF0234 family)
MPSFDIVSKPDMAEIDNALGNVTREIGTRFDFKGSKCTVERKEETLTLAADDQPKLDQMHELLKVHFTRRKVEPGYLTFETPEKATGDSLRQIVKIKVGVESELARKIVKSLKDSKLKVQASIQGDELRVTGKKRDDLQDAIAHIRGLALEQPLQYVNFRD